MKRAQVQASYRAAAARKLARQVWIKSVSSAARRDPPPRRRLDCRKPQPVRARPQNVLEDFFRHVCAQVLKSGLQ